MSLTPRDDGEEKARPFQRAWPPYIVKGVDHAHQPFYTTTDGLRGNLPMLPLPRDDAQAFDIRLADGPGVPTFDPRVHLALELPDYVERLGSFERIGPCEVPQVTSNRGSELAFTAPFRLLSDEGVAALRKVLEYHTPKKTHRSYQHRGLYHFSPFVRAMLNDPSLLAFFGRLTGEPVTPHQLLMDAAFANSSRVGEDAVVAGTADPWHFDSCTYVAVTLLSDPMEGGDLEVVRRGRDEALHRIAETGNRLAPPEIATVDYQRPGRCILVQGSEIVHRVTPVRKSPTGAPRVAFGIGLQPASPFRWDKTNLDTFARYDGLPVAAYEFYRQKTHALGSALTELARVTPSSTAQTVVGRQELAERLRGIAAEAERVAELLETPSLPASDFVGFVDESKLKDPLRAAL